MECSSTVPIIIAKPICVFFCHSFQRKVEMFHEGLVSAFGENEDGYVAKTIALANCCPPFRYIYTSFFVIIILSKLLLFIDFCSDLCMGKCVCVHCEQELCRAMCTQWPCCQWRLWPQSQHRPGQDRKPECESAEWQDIWAHQGEYVSHTHTHFTHRHVV